MELKGYAGKILKVNLSTQTHEEFPFEEQDYLRTLGGKIMAADILYHHIRPGMQAYDEDNWVVITTGPLTGCGCPSTSRFNLSTISPLTGILTSSNCGGNFGLMLKKAGYDGLIIEGKAKQPVHLEITQQKIAFHSAQELWGLKVGPAQEKLPPRHGKMVIGPAGENKVLYAGVFSGERAAGRGGVGAVFGDKNLKAVTAFGTKQMEIAQPEKLKAINKKWVSQLRAHPLTGRQLPKLGTAGLIAPMQAGHILATKNFNTGRFDGFEKVCGERLAEKYLVKNTGCTSCAIQCARQVEIDGKKVKGPELETLGLLGPNLLNDDLELILRWNYELDELGMDTISTAGTIAFAMELQEKGKWDSGLEFGKTQNLSKVFEDIAYRRGIGDELADGSRALAAKYGERQCAMQVKGMELAAYEPRGAVGQGLGYATANRGGCHLNAGYLVVLEGLGLHINPYTKKGKAALCVLFQNLMEGVSAGGSCLFTTYAFFPGFLIDKPRSIATRMVNKAFCYLGPAVHLLTRFPKIASINLPMLRHTSAIAAATGRKMNLGRLMRIGEYGYNLERACNVLLGQREGADTLPGRLTQQEQIAGQPRTKVPLDDMLGQYYRIRGWEKGAPTQKTRKRLGIDPRDERKGRG